MPYTNFHPLRAMTTTTELLCGVLCVGYCAFELGRRDRPVGIEMRAQSRLESVGRAQRSRSRTQWHATKQHCVPLCGFKRCQVMFGNERGCAEEVLDGIVDDPFRLVKGLSY